jgi:hypothetical protein
VADHAPERAREDTQVTNDESPTDIEIDDDPEYRIAYDASG